MQVLAFQGSSAPSPARSHAELDMTDLSPEILRDHDDVSVGLVRCSIFLHSVGSWADQRSSVLGCEQLAQCFELLSLWHVKLCSCLCNRGSQVDMDDMDDMPHDDAMLEDFELERLHQLRYSPLTKLLPPYSLHQ